MKCSKLAMWVVGACLGSGPMLARASSPTTQPLLPDAADCVVLADANPSVDQPGPTARPERRFNEGPGMHPMRPGGGHLNRLEPPTSVEWDEMAAFMQENSPVRLKFIENLPENSRKSYLKSLAFQVYRNYQRVKREDPGLAEIVVERVKLEDNVFDLANQIRHADPSHAENLRAQFRARVGDLIDTNLKERQLRIDRLQATLKKEQDRLADDTRQRDKLVEDRITTELRTGN